MAFRSPIPRDKFGNLPKRVRLLINITIWHNPFALKLVVETLENGNSQFCAKLVPKGRCPFTPEKNQNNDRLFWTVG